MKSFNYPIHFDDFWELCNPNPSSPFHRPFYFKDGLTAMANGRMAILTRQAVLDEDMLSDEDSEKPRRRLESLDWSLFDTPERNNFNQWETDNWNKKWRLLTNLGAALVRPEVPAFQPTLNERDKGGFDFVDKPRLAVGATRILVPVSILQLIRRLPNPEIYPLAWTNDHDKRFRWLPFRFTGGHGLAASVPMVRGLPADEVPPLYAIMAPQTDRALELFENSP